MRHKNIHLRAGFIHPTHLDYERDEITGSRLIMQSARYLLTIPNKGVTHQVCHTLDGWNSVRLQGVNLSSCPRVSYRRLREGKIWIGLKRLYVLFGI